MKYIDVKENQGSLILDSNIIIYLSQPWTEKQINNELASLRSNYSMYLSQITRYEILKSNEINKESKLPKSLNTFKSIEITEEILIISALFYRLFKKDHDKNIQDPDVIIASTSFLIRSSILTVNRNDFPYPYFKEEKVTPILYNRVPHKTDCLLLTLLQPNTNLIKNEIDKIFNKSI